MAIYHIKTVPKHWTVDMVSKVKLDNYTSLQVASKPEATRYEGSASNRLHRHS